MSRTRTRTLTLWGKEVQKRMIDRDMTAMEVVDILRANGIPTITSAKFSAMLTGTVGTRSPEMVAAIDELLGIPPEVPGRPA